MSATAWQRAGPYHTSLINTSNSQYGAWNSKGPNLNSKQFPFDSLKGTLTGSEFSHTTTTPGLSSATGQAGLPITNVADLSGHKVQELITKERLAELMSNYSGTSKIPVYPPQSSHNKPVTSADVYIRPRTTSINGIDPEPTIKDSRTSSGHLSHLTDKTSDQTYSMLPIRSKQMSGDLDFHKPHTMNGNYLSNQMKHSEGTPHLLPFSDKTNIENYQPRSFDLTPGLNHSNTFHGTLDNRTGTLGGTSTHSYTNGTENMLGDSKYISGHEPHRVDPGHYTSTDLSHDRRGSIGAEVHIPKPPSTEPPASQERFTRSWLTGTSGRPSTQPRPFTPYKPGDYVSFRTSSAESSHRAPGDLLPRNKAQNSGSIVVNKPDVLEPAQSRDRYTKIQAPSMGQPDRFQEFDDIGLSNMSKTYQSVNTDYQPLNTDSKLADMMGVIAGRAPKKSILKKGSGTGSRSATLDSRRSVYANDIYSLGSGRGMLRTDPHPLPPLSANDVPSRSYKYSSGKRVTFNLALNRSKPILD